ncbi:MAG: outer membrane lipoprotein carrier protein LolA [Bacteroidales bacterium]|nr:outer membrane lipoprotein carrier protein LolA [Bacteroidales bacterium]MBR6865515.1 outer membrane lipoprotein carrier protein LolA [Bacteroidales bacterium]
MKKLLILFAFLAFGLTASAQELSATFIQKKTIKATHKVIPGEGTVTFSAPDQLRMTYAVPEGEYLIIDGNKLESCVKGKAITFDTAKNPRMRKMRNTLLNCITGDYEKAAEENDAALVVEQKGDVKTVSMMARKPQPTGYARITLDYNKKGLPIRMVLDEFAGIETEYTFKY